MSAAASGPLRLSLLALLLVVATVQASPAMIPLTLPSGKEVKAELMVEDQDRAMGLMFRPSLPGDRVLLFVFDFVDFHGIWMKNCRFPIDIVWLDEEHQVVHLVEAAPPCRKEPCPVYQPMRKAAFVVEMNAGQAAGEGIEVGKAVSFELPR